MNNLEKAKRALKGIKSYTVLMSTRKSWSAEVDAQSEEEAEELAKEMWQNGDLDEDDESDLQIDDIELNK